MAGFSLQQALQLASHHLQGGRSAEAESVCRDILNQLPNCAEAHYLRGMNFQQQGLLDDAITAYEQALRVNPNLAEAYNNRGIACSQRAGGMPEAIAHFENAIRLQPGNAMAHNNLANVLQEMGRLDDAAAALRTAAAARSEPGDGGEQPGEHLPRPGEVG